MDISEIANAIILSYAPNSDLSSKENAHNAVKHFIVCTQAGFRKSIVPMDRELRTLMTYLSTVHMDPESPLILEIEEKLLLIKLDKLL